MSELEQRIARLERENRLMKRAAFGVFAVFGGVILIGQAACVAPGNKIKTGSLEIVNSSGKSVIKLFSVGPSSAAIEMGDGNKTLFSVSALKVGALLQLGDHESLKSSPGIALSVMEKIGANLTMCDRNGTARVHFSPDETR